METKIRKCTKCGRELPPGYKYEKCERCRQPGPHALKGVLTVAGVLVTFTVAAIVGISKHIKK